MTCYAPTPTTGLPVGDVGARETAGHDVEVVSSMERDGQQANTSSR